MEPAIRIPVTIITGFLGAGKTTLLNQIIQDHSQTRFAIIENEFGKESVDNELILEVDGGIFELSKGCICCTLNDDLIDVLESLLGRADEFDHLIVETTGIAEPAEIAGVFLAEPRINSEFELNSIVCVVDAEQMFEELNDRPEVRQQLIYADLILVNKTDLIKPDLLESVEQVIPTINPFADVYRSVKGKPEPAVIDNLLLRNAFDPERVKERLDHQNGMDDRHNDIVSHSFRIKEPIDPIKFGQWIQRLLMMQRDRIYRIKGIMNFPYRDCQIVFQSVGRRHIYSKGGNWHDNEEKLTRLVFIGRDLKREAIETALNHCRWVDIFSK